MAFHKDTLRNICRLRDSLLRLRVLTDEAALLRATALGVLHGPLTTTNSYLSNQMPRTFAAKPAYAVKFWKQRGDVPTRVPILHALGRKLALIESSLNRLRHERLDDIIIGDAATKDAFKHAPRLVDVVITSPPYYGMMTYVQDQWLRNWFLGGPPEVDYSTAPALPSSSPATLRRAWD